jgi:hypothetical protein
MAKLETTSAGNTTVQTAVEIAARSKACFGGPPGFCCLLVICLGAQKFAPKLAPRADLGACSDRTKAPQQQERPRSIAYKLNG